MAVTYLDRIIDEHRAAAADDVRSTAALTEQAMAAPPVRGFESALRGPGLSVISEVKRRSPSKGDLFAGLDPATLAGQYEAGGSTCLSVLTDADNFGGSPSDLQAARGAVSLPALRKDFTVHEHDVLDARIMGADCVLLIVAALGRSELEHFAGVARTVGIDILFETHDENEIERACAAGVTLLGVNQRDLFTFEVDHERAVRVVAAFPEGVVGVCESGVRGAADAAALAVAGYDAILVGESLVTSGDPQQAVAELIAAGNLAQDL